MDQSISSKAARQKRKRLRQKEKLKEISKTTQEAKSHVENGIEEHKQEEVVAQEQISEMNKNPEKSREQVLAERQAKKAAGKKPKETPAVSGQPAVAAQIVQKPDMKQPAENSHVVTAPAAKLEKTREQILAEREAKKNAKLSGKKEKPSEDKSRKIEKPQEVEIVKKMENLEIKSEQPKDAKKELTKAERRAIQEAQRAAKAKALEETKKPQKPTKSQETPKKVTTTAQTPVKTHQTPVHPTNPVKPYAMSTTHKVKLFKHLYLENPDLNIKVNSDIHPAIIQLGFQYATSSIVGSNARCYAFLQAVRNLISDFVTPAEKIFSRGLEAEILPAMEFLQKCRPFAVSMTNALKYIKLIISQENSNDTDSEKRARLIEKIETYAHEQIETAAISISLKLREKISDGDVILTFGCSSLIRRSLVEAKESSLKFRVIVVDSRPDFEGQKMLDSLTVQGISCTYVLINSVSFIMPEVTKVILGAHALLANGTVMSRVGTAQVCLIANAYNVPVLVCCETHKFSERVQTDSFVYNEIGDPNALIFNKNTGKSSEHLKDWELNNHLTPLNLKYDVTPPELITAVVTEVAILPSTSVQVILRVKPSE